jgi:hypothetical protein
MGELWEVVKINMQRLVMNNKQGVFEHIFHIPRSTTRILNYQQLPKVEPEEGILYPKNAFY